MILFYILGAIVGLWCCVTWVMGNAIMFTMGSTVFMLLIVFKNTWLDKRLRHSINLIDSLKFTPEEDEVQCSPAIQRQCNSFNTALNTWIAFRLTSIAMACIYILLYAIQSESFYILAVIASILWGVSMIPWIISLCQCMAGNVVDKQQELHRVRTSVTLWILQDVIFSILLTISILTDHVQVSVTHALLYYVVMYMFCEIYGIHDAFPFHLEKGICKRKCFSSRNLILWIKLGRIIPCWALAIYVVTLQVWTIESRHIEVGIIASLLNIVYWISLGSEYDEYQ